MRTARLYHILELGDRCTDLAPFVLRLGVEDLRSQVESHEYEMTYLGS